MHKRDIDDTEIVIPKRSKTPSRKRPQTAIKRPAMVRGLYSPRHFDDAASTFDAINPQSDLGDPIMRVQNPGLLALRQKAKTRPSSKKTSRPMTAMAQPSAAQMMPSLLNKHPLSQLREPEVSTKEVILQRIENEKLSIAFKEDPIAYFSKRKDGRGHRFIYLNHIGDRSDPFFNPYLLTKVSSADIHEEYFTMSANGVTHVMPDGNTEHVSLDIWAKHSAIFESIRKLKMFKNYYFWKTFKIWKNFVMKQRYDEISDRVMTYSIYNNPAYYATALNLLYETFDPYMKQYLLCFQSQKKYRIEAFLEETKASTSTLNQQYEIFLNNLIDQLVTLDSDIRDPARVVVKDSDFPEIKRRNPNLGQLKILEVKKYTESLRRNEVVKKEIVAFCDFVRLADYILLESLASSCFKAWKAAEYEITSDMASIFEIEISFDDDGEIVFTPNLEVLIQTVTEALHKSLENMDTRPRLIMATALRKQMRDNFPNLNDLFDRGPNFHYFIQTNMRFKQIEAHILSVIKSSFKDAEQSTQVFKDFFPIYQIGRFWSAESYIHDRGGNIEPIDLSTSSILSVSTENEMIVFDSSKEPIVDFGKIREDVERFRNDEVMLTQFRACTVRGALYIDSKRLRGILAPIPIRSIHAVTAMLENLMQRKVDSLSHIMKYCGNKLKKEPQTLEGYIDYVDFLNRTLKLNQLFMVEMAFVDDLLGIFEDLNLPLKQESKLNPLHSEFHRFKVDQQAANGIKDLHSDKFVYVLQQKLRQTDRRLQKYHDYSTAYPNSIDQVELDKLLLVVTKRKIKVIAMENEIIELIKCQKILNMNVTDFGIYKQVQIDSIFMERIYKAISKWKEINSIITNEPLMSIEMDQFIEDVSNLEDECNAMKKELKIPNQLLNELIKKVGEIAPYLIQLRQLCSGRMQLHHWNKLFEECGQPNAYYGQIKIEELLSLGILQEKDKIARITSTSQGESQLEAEFQEINNHWKSVTIPLLEDQINADDSLLLGPLGPLFDKIGETQTRLLNMLEISFVQGIKGQVTFLSTSLENAAKILEQWQLFQSNWEIISPIFQLDEVRLVLPQQAQKYQMIKRRWVSLVKHTRENTILFNVCSFPTLFDMLTENNKSLEAILYSIHKYLDIKRASFPRLYYLSDNEVLTLLSTNDFKVFNKHISKIFMHMKELDSHTQDSHEVTQPKSNTIQNFSNLTIYGLIGDDGGAIQFNSPVQCNGPLEQWVTLVINQMRDTLRENLATSIANYQSGQLSNWVLTIPTYIAILTLHIVYTRDIEECFINFENNAKAFSNYEAILQTKIQELTAVMSSPLAANDLLKLSAISCLLNYQCTQTKLLNEKYQFYSQKLFWVHHIRFTFNLQKSTVNVEFDDDSVEHGYEYFGSCIPFIHTPSSERALLNLANSMTNNKFGLLFGGFGIGKKKMIDYLASMYGQFTYFVPSFTDYSTNVLTRLFTGVASTGTWMCFTDLHEQTHEKLCFIYEIMKSIAVLSTVGGTRININNKVVEIQKTTKIFVTADQSFLTRTTIPPQLRGLLKPIAFNSPDLRHICEIKLVSLGFKTVKHVSVKLTSVLCTIKETFVYITDKYLMHTLFQILDESTNLLRQLMHSKSPVFVNYYDSARIAEEFVVSRALYIHFKPLIREEHHTQLFQLIFSSFKIFNTFEDFIKNIKSPNCFLTETAEELMAEASTEYLKNAPEKLNKDYYVSKLKDLYNLMLRHKLIIITGPPSSGKSALINLLQQTFNTLSHKADVMNRFPGLQNVKIAPVFHESDSIERIYGSNNEDEILGYQTLYGMIDSVIQNLFDVEGGDYHMILKFDGPITTTFVNELFPIIDGISSNIKGRLNNLETIEFDQKFHFIVETESIQNISPAFINHCGILPMESNFDLPATFDRLAPKDNDDMKNIFIDYVPKVLEYVQSKCIDLPKQFINQTLLKKVIDYIFMYKAQILSETKKLNIVCGLSFFTIYSGILPDNETEAFDKFIQSTFEIDFPPDWIGFSAPNHFLDVFPTPSIQSLRFYKNQLIPLDFTPLVNKPMFKKSERSLTTKFLSDISICTSHFLPVIFEASLLMKNKKHFLLYGERPAGKSNFLTYLFQNAENVVPVFIEAGKFSIQENLVDFIISHTQTTEKEFTMIQNPITYALVFDNVDPENLHTIEFIRMIVSTNILTNSSKYDPKFLDPIKLRNYFVVVTSKSIDKFRERFISHFVPIKLPTPPKSTCRYLFTKASTAFGITSEFADQLFTFTDSLPNDFGINQIRLLESLAFIEEKGTKDQTQRETCLRLILEEINFFYLHKHIDDSIKNKLKMMYLTIFTGETEKQILDEFIEETCYYYPNISIKDDLSSFHVDVNKTTPSELKEKLKDNVLEFSRFVINQYLLLTRAITYPGGSVMLKGRSGSGRYSMAKFVAKEQSMLFIEAPSEGIEGFLRDIIGKAVFDDKFYLIFSRETNEKLIYFIETADILSLFNCTQLEQIYFRLSKNEHNIENYNKLRDIIKNKLHYAITVPENYDESKHPSFYTVQFNIQSEEQFEQIANELPEKLPNLFANIHSFSENATTNMFYDFIKTFKHLSIKRNEEIVIENENMIQSLEFVKHIYETQKQIEHNIEVLTPKIQELDSSSAELEEELKQKRDAVQEQATKFTEEENKFVMDISKMKNELEGIISDFEIIAQQMPPLLEKVLEISENDVKILQLSADSPAPKYQAFFAILSLLLGMPSAYEPNGKSIATNSEIVKVVSEQINKNDVSSDTLEKVKKIFENNKFNHQEMEEIAPALGVLYDYINVVFQYACRKEAKGTKEQFLQMKEKEYGDYMESTKSERENIKKCFEQLDQEMEGITSKSEEKERAEKELEDSHSRKKNIESLIDGLEYFEAKWKDDTSKIEERKTMTLGNSILFSSYLVYCGMMDLKQRTNFLHAVISTLNENEIKVSDSQDLSIFISSQLALLYNDNSKDVNYDTEMDLRHINSVLRTPLIIDKECLIMEALISNKKNIIKISLLSSQLHSCICDAMTNGKTLVITDVNYITPLLENLLQIDLDPNEREVEIQRSIVNKMKKFKLYLFTSYTKGSLIPEELRSRTTVIDVSLSSLYTVNDMITKTFLEHFDPALVSKTESVKSIETRFIVDASRYESDFLNSMSTCMKKGKEYDFLADDSMLQDLLKAKESYTATINHQNTSEIRKELKQTLEPYENLINLCQKIWETIASYLPEYHISFSNYMQLIKNGIVASNVRPGILTEENRVVVKKALTATVMKGLLLNLPFNVSMFFMFMISMSLEKEQKENDFNEIVQNLRDQYNGIINTNPIDLFNGGAIEQLKYSNIVNVFPFVNRFIADKLGKDYTSFLPIFQIEYFISSNSQTPVIVTCSKNRDPTLLLDLFISMRNRMDSYEVYSLYDDASSLENIKNNVIAAMGKGVWVAIHYTKPSRQTAACISDIIYQMGVPGSMTSNFRLIILAHSLEFLSTQLLAKANRCNFEEFPSIRHQMLQIFQHHAASIRSTTNPKLMKKISYAAILLYSILNYREFINPLGFTQHFYIDEICVKETIEYLRSIIDSHPQQELPYRNIRDALQEDIYGGGFIDTFDRRKMRVHIFSLITPDVGDDGFRFLDKNSDEFDRWFIPTDAPITNYSHMIEKLPVFTTCDILLMSHNMSLAIRDWNLSRWVSRPFLKYAPAYDFDKKDTLKYLLDNLPRPLEYEIDCEMPLDAFLSSEIEHYNKGLRYILASTDVVVDPENVPTKWSEVMGYSGTKHLHQFVEYVKERYAFLGRWAQSKQIPGQVNCHLIYNIKGLLHAFLHQDCIERNTTIDMMTYDFSFSKMKSDRALILTNTCLMGAALDSKGELTIPGLRSALFTKMSPLYCSTVKRSVKNTRLFMCPMFQSLPCKDHAIASEVELVDGELANFLWYVPIPTELSDKQLISEGVAIICQLPDIFETINNQ